MSLAHVRASFQGDDEMEDVMVLVHKGGVRLYCTPPCAPRLNTITAAWANCEVLLLDGKSFKDQVFGCGQVFRGVLTGCTFGCDVLELPYSDDARPRPEACLLANVLFLVVKFFGALSSSCSPPRPGST